MKAGQRLDLPSGTALKPGRSASLGYHLILDLWPRTVLGHCVDNSAFSPTPTGKQDTVRNPPKRRDPQDELLHERVGSRIGGWSPVLKRLHTSITTSSIECRFEPGLCFIFPRLLRPQRRPTLMPRFAPHPPAPPDMPAPAWPRGFLCLMLFLRANGQPAS